MAKVHIDGKEYEVDDSKNMLEVCLEEGFDLPYFCWHPHMGSVGACRQCAVKQYKDEDDDQGNIVMSCMTPAEDGTRVAVHEEEVEEFRASIIEWLMVNHPHDCPVCDEGGECHLQDMTVMTGHTYRRYRFGKRTYRNQYLGPFINHEMNRCIQCYRCVRFYRDHAGGDDLQEFAIHDEVYFGRHEDGPLQNELSGNLVEVCPTGVFTDKTLKEHYTRKWDLQTAPSVCVHCSLGCNTTPGERYGTLRRIRARYHSAINGYFLCDRGRYGYPFVNDERRITHPLLPSGPNERAEPLTTEDAIRKFAEISKNAKGVVGIGSPRASLETNFALKQWVGTERFHQGVSKQQGEVVARVLAVLSDARTRIASLEDIADSDAIVIFGEDTTNTAPLATYALRQAAKSAIRKKAVEAGIHRWNAEAIENFIQDDRGPFYIATPLKTKLDGEATRVFRLPPSDIARLAWAIAHRLDDAAPDAEGLGDELQTAADEIAEKLRKADKPLIVSGAGLGAADVICGAANVAWACSSARSDDQCQLFVALSECNSMGLAMLGGDYLEGAIDALESGGSDTAIIVENDLFQRMPPKQARRLLDAAKNIIVIDHIAHETAAAASLVLPAATFAEADGTLVNNEGRAQRFHRVYPADKPVQDGWRWLRHAAGEAGIDTVAWDTVPEVLRALARSSPEFAPIERQAVSTDRPISVPRQPDPYSGRTATHAHETIREPRAPEDPDSPLVFSMEGAQRNVPAKLVSHFRAPGWNSIQALTRFQEEINGPLRGGEGGVRLLESRDADGYFQEVPAKFEARADELRLVPLHHIFGSEELSSIAGAIRERAPGPHVLINTEDGTARGLDDDSAVIVQTDHLEHRCSVRTADEVPRGVAAVFVGPLGFHAGPLPQWGRIEKAGS